MPANLSHSFIKTIEVPFAKIRGIVALIVKGIRDGRHLWRQLILVPRDGFVRITTTDERAAKWAAERRTGDGLFEDDSLFCKTIEMRGADIGITTKAESLAAMLIAKNPDEVGRGEATHAHIMQIRGCRRQPLQIQTYWAGPIMTCFSLGSAPSSTLSRAGVFSAP